MMNLNTVKLLVQLETIENDQSHISNLASDMRFCTQ